METVTTRIREDVPQLMALPQTALANEVLELVKTSESPAIANHSIRSYLFARLYAAHDGLREGRDYDSELLFFACVLHDIGLAHDAKKSHRFEVEGADRAAELLTRRGLAADRVDAVWQAIALNTSIGIAERRGVICALTLGGVTVDCLGDDGYIPDATARAIHAVYPRLSLARELADAVVAQAQHDPANAPLWSMPGDVVRERSLPPHVSSLEQLIGAGRWKE